MAIFDDKKQQQMTMKLKTKKPINPAQPAAPKPLQSVNPFERPITGAASKYIPRPGIDLPHGRQSEQQIAESNRRFQEGGLSLFSNKKNEQQTIGPAQQFQDMQNRLIQQPDTRQVEAKPAIRQTPMSPQQQAEQDYLKNLRNTMPEGVAFNTDKALAGFRAQQAQSGQPVANAQPAQQASSNLAPSIPRPGQLPQAPAQTAPDDSNIDQQIAALQQQIDALRAQKKGP